MSRSKQLWKFKGIVVLLVSLLFSANLVNAAEQANFSGVWMLIKDKSINLPRLLASTDEYLLIIEQKDTNTISLATEIRSRGQSINGEPDIYAVDGNTIEKDDKQRGIKSRRSFRYTEDQQRLLVETEKRFYGEIRFPDTDESETWELTDNGRALIITITPKKDPEQKQVRVFVKKQSGI